MVFDPPVKVIQHLVESPLVDTTYSTLFCPECVCVMNDQCVHVVHLKGQRNSFDSLFQSSSGTSSASRLKSKLAI